MQRTRRPAAAALLLFALLATACSDTAPDADPSSFEAFKAVVLAHEEAIADCMRGEGFDYVAHLPSDLVLEEAAVRAEREGRDPVEAIEAVEAPRDPNAEVLESLSDQQQEAWQAAYWGDEVTGAPGCYYGTYERIWGIDPFVVDEEQTRTVERIYADPRLVRAEQDYVDCMGEAGYELHGIDDIFRLLEEVAPSGTDQRDAPDQFRQEAFAHHDRCRVPYDELYDVLHAEYFDYSYDRP